MNKKITVCSFIAGIIIAACFIWQGAAVFNRPNIILITLDALRPDHLGSYGYVRTTSPTIDNLANNGTIFTNAIASGAQTATSNASLITSTYPFIHGIRDWGYQFSPDTPKTLPVILKHHGYDTAFISDHVLFSLIKDFEKGFDTFNTIIAIPPPTFQTRVVEITDWAISWLQAHNKKKFFLWLYYLTPHGPYIPDEPFNKMFVLDKFYNKEKTAPISGNLFDQSPIGAIPKYLAIDGIREIDFYIAQYDGEIRRADAQIARLLLELNKLGLDKNTLVIINSDHGESMGEHARYFCHANSLYDELVKTTLILHGTNKIPHNLKIDHQVRNIDIMPTILDLIKIKSAGMQGQSLLPLMNGTTRTASAFAFSEQGPLLSVRTKRWKLIYDEHNQQYELYDLINDPGERTNIAGQRTAVFRHLQRQLNNYLARSKQLRPIMKSPLNPEALERLHALGYAQ